MGFEPPVIFLWPGLSAPPGSAWCQQGNIVPRGLFVLLPASSCSPVPAWPPLRALPSPINRSAGGNQRHKTSARAFFFFFFFFSPCCCRQLCVSLPLPAGRPASRGGAPQGARIEQKLQPEGIWSPSSPDPSARRALTLPPGPALAWIFSFSPPGPCAGAPHAAGRGPSRRAAPRLWPPSLLPSPQLSGFLSADTAPAGCCSTQPTPPAPGRVAQEGHSGPGSQQRDGMDELRAAPESRSLLGAL